MITHYNFSKITPLTDIYKMVGDDGIEPPQADSKSAALPLCKSPVKLERVEGIEPSHGLWKSPRLPLHHTRFKMAEREGFEPSGVLRPRSFSKALH
jgi:hypothetical protein